MSSIEVRFQAATAEVVRTVGKLAVFDVRVRDDAIDYGSVHQPATLVVGTTSGSGSIRAYTNEFQYGNVYSQGNLAVTVINPANNVRYIPAFATVKSVVVAASPTIKPVDENQMPQEAGETIPVTSIDLDLAVSFDTYFDFNMRSIAGIKTVLDENNLVVVSGYDNYRFGDLQPGVSTRRTIVTENDLRLSLNVRPTIVKSTND